MNKIQSVSDIRRRAKQLSSAWESSTVFFDLLKEYPTLNVYIAGGALRDLSLGNERRRDMDVFFTGIDTELVLARLKETGTIEFGPFGSPRWYPSAFGTNYVDVIPIESFYNGLWRCNDIWDVLNQFDFTANAVAIDLRNWNFFDPLNGFRDQKKRIMKAVRFDYPDEPITRECPLSRLCVLWFRLMHYAVTLELNIEPVTRRWLRNNSKFQRCSDEFGRYFFEPNVSLLASL